MDTKDLLERARSSEEGEAFQTLHRTEAYRVGAGARLPRSFFIEVVVTPFPGGTVDLDHLEMCLTLLRALQERGMAIGCQDRQTICCELAVREEKVDGEVAAALEAGRSTFGV